MMNTKELATNAAARIESRMVAVVSRKLGCDVTLARWIEKTTGDIPVFRVPATVADQAKALGLTIESA